MKRGTAKYRVVFYVLVASLLLTFMGCSDKKENQDPLPDQPPAPYSGTQPNNVPAPETGKPGTEQNIPPEAVQPDSTTNKGPEPAAPLEPVPAEAMITAGQLHKELKTDEDWRLADGRDFAEYAVGHIPGAISVPVANLKKRLNYIPKDKKVVFIFSNDEDAQKGWQILMSNGYDSKLVKVLQGGIDQWKQDGYETDIHRFGGCG